MSEDQRQRQMDFILDSMARLSATTNRLAEFHLHDRERMARLETSFVAVAELLRRHEERHDLAERWMAGHEQLHDKAHRWMANIESAVILQLQLIRNLRLSRKDAGQDT